VGWGIVGTGKIAEHFAADLAHVDGAYVAAVTSRSFDKAADFAARHGGNAHAQLASLLCDEGVDAVYVASPNDSHFNAALAAISANKGVLVEKPLVTTLADAERLSALALERNIFLMEGMWTRFLPAIAFLRNAIQSGTIGEVLRLKGELAFLQPYDPDNRFFDPAKGGGALLDPGRLPYLPGARADGTPRRDARPLASSAEWRGHGGRN
jgi:predicted dehydrogenase